MRYFVTLKKGQSFTVRGPVSNKLYKFKLDDPQLVHPGDWEYFRTMPSRFEAFTDQETQGGAPAKPRKRRPIDHHSVSEFARTGKSIPPAEVAALENQRLIEERARNRMELLKAERAKAEAALRKSEEKRRKADPALNARSPEEARAMLDMQPPPPEMEDPPKPRPRKKAAAKKTAGRKARTKKAAK